MRGQRHANRVRTSAIFIRPQFSAAVASRGKVVESISAVNGLIPIIQVEKRKIENAILPGCCPRDRITFACHLALLVRILIDIEDIPVGEETHGPVIELGEVGTDDERRTHHGPERDHHSLFGLRQACLTRLAITRLRSEITEGKHIGIGPCTRMSVGSPCRSKLKLIVHAARRVPRIAGRADRRDPAD